MDEYDGRQVVGIDLHRRRSVIVRMSEAGQRLEAVRIDNDPVALAREVAKAGEAPEVVQPTSGAEALPGVPGEPLDPDPFHR